MPFARDIAARVEIQFRRETLKNQDAVASVAYHCDHAIHACMIGQEKTTSATAGTPDSRFLVMSITKSFTAVAVLRLIAAGGVELDGPLSRWLPKIPHASRITVRQCLQHTSGLPDYGPLKSYHEATTPVAIQAGS